MTHIGVTETKRTPQNCVDSERSAGLFTSCFCIAAVAAAAAGSGAGSGCSPAIGP